MMGVFAFIAESQSSHHEAYFLIKPRLAIACQQNYFFFAIFLEKLNLVREFG